MFEFRSESTREPGKDFQLGSGVIRFAFYVQSGEWIGGDRVWSQEISKTPDDNDSVKGDDSKS